jgi:hypothetical protein
MFEAIMLVCFGISWPVSIYKSWTVKKVTGKSVVFLWMIFTGYVSGLFHKYFYSFDMVIILYSMNAIMVLVDIILYYKYRYNN